MRHLWGGAAERHSTNRMRMRQQRPHETLRLGGFPSVTSEDPPVAPAPVLQQAAHRRRPAQAWPGTGPFSQAPRRSHLTTQGPWPLLPCPALRVQTTGDCQWDFISRLMWCHLKLEAVATRTAQVVCYDAGCSSHSAGAQGTRCPPSPRNAQPHLQSVSAGSNQPSVHSETASEP